MKKQVVERLLRGGGTLCYLYGTSHPTTIEIAQSYPPPSKVVERFVDSPFWQSCGFFFQNIEFKQSCGKNNESCGNLSVAEKGIVEN